MDEEGLAVEKRERPAREEGTVVGGGIWKGESEPAMSNGYGWLLIGYGTFECGRTLPGGLR